jgi:hypothetical protein
MIIQPIKKKSFMKSFISPERPKNEADERQVLSPPLPIIENPEMYRI